MEAILSSPDNETLALPTKRRMDDYKRIVLRAREKAREHARTADKLVRDRPYHSIGVAVGLGVLVGALFAFITSFDELIVALFLSGSGAITLPRRMWDDLRFAIDPTIAAVSTLTIVLAAALLGGAHILRQRPLNRQR